MTVCLGLDYGLRRIGVAAGDSERRLAFAVGTHVEGKGGSVVEYLRGLVAERGVDRIVVGLPLTADGRETDIALRARRFAGVLERELGLPVVLWDERYSSAEADRWLPAGRRADKGERDALAAEIILQSYLDSLAAGGGSGEPQP
jgi:putative Holliday junction resolvase